MDTNEGVQRFLPDGATDTSFGTGGYVALASAAADPAEGVAGSRVAADGGVTILFSTELPSTPDPDDRSVVDSHTRYTLRHLKPDGSLDPSFGGTGEVLVGVVDRMSASASSKGSASASVDLAVDADGRPSVRVHYSYYGDLGSYFVDSGGPTYRFQADGTPAPQTDQDGQLTSRVIGSTAALPGGGNYVYFPGMYGYGYDPQTDAGLYRITTTGQIDTSFGDAGHAHTANLGLAIYPAPDTVNTVLATPDGDAVLVATSSASGDVAVIRVSGGDPLPAAVARLPQTIAVGSGNGLLQVQLPSGSQITTIQPFAGFTGNVRTATADFNGDGVDDIVVGTGPGVATQVQVLDGRTLAQLFSVRPFEASFTGGVYLAAGDLTGDGVPELVVSPDEGGGPRVKVYDGKTFAVAADFFGIDDPNFRGGARTAVGDVNGDGTNDLGVAAGFGGGPRVSVYNGTTVTSGRPANLFNDFFAFEDTLRNGVFLALGDTNGDGFADIVAGGGPGGGPRVTVTDGKPFVAAGTTTYLANFFAGDPNSRGGVAVAVKNLDDDARADVVTGGGSGSSSQVIGYYGNQLTTGGEVPEGFDIKPLPGYTGGVYVG